MHCATLTTSSLCIAIATVSELCTTADDSIFRHRGGIHVRVAKIVAQVFNDHRHMFSLERSHGRYLLHLMRSQRGVFTAMQTDTQAIISLCTGLALRVMF